MGLNLNYHLLKEGANSKFSIPNYHKAYNAPISESDMIDKITKFNISMKNNIIAFNESDAYTDSVNGVVLTINDAINNVREVKTSLENFINQTINSISKKIPADSYEAGIPLYKRNELLSKVINNTRPEELGIKISGIESNLLDILDPDMPKTDIIGSKLRDCVAAAINGATSPIRNDNEEDNHASESILSFIDSTSDDLIHQMTNNKFNYDKTDLNGSIIKASESSFGGNERVDNAISVNLYGNACYNLEDAQRSKAIDCLVAMKEKVSTNYGLLLTALEIAKEDVIKASNNIPANYSVSVKDNINNKISKVVSNVNYILGIVRSVINVNAKMITHKAIRINQLFNLNPAYGDSAKVRCNCIALMKKFQDVEDTTPISGLQAAQEANDMLNDYECMMAMLEEVIMEHAENMNTVLALNEADDNGQQYNDKAADAAINAARGKVDVNAGERIDRFNFIDKIMDKLTQMVDKFRTTITNFMATSKDRKFWDLNRDSLKSINLSNDSTCNEWYDYNIDDFKTTFIKDQFDITDPNLESDEKYAGYLLSLFKNGVESQEDDSFNAKMKKRFYKQYIDKDGGVPLNTVFDNTKVFPFVDDFVRNQWNGDCLGRCNDEFKKLNDQYKKAKTDIKQQADKFADANHAAKPQESTGEPKGNANGETAGNNGNKSGGAENVQAQNNSAVLDLSDFKFNLAENFALIQNMDTPIMNLLNEEVNLDPKDTSEESMTSKDRSGLEKEALAAINRYFKYNSYTLTVKMTEIWAAYKQYMNVYKTMKGYKVKGNDVADKNDNNNNQNQNNNQQQAQQQQNQNNK